MFGIEIWAFWLAMAITLGAGFVKGAIGFAMPLIMVSALGSFLPHEIVLTAIMLPLLFSNLMQCLRDGWRSALRTAWDYRLMLAVTMGFILISAQFVESIPDRALLLALGLPITAYAGAQLAGLPLVLNLTHRRRAEVVLGAVGGIYGGIAAIWGPPLIVYLLSLRVPKVEAMRVQGVFFFLGSIMLMAGHLTSGVLTADRMPLSVALAVPALAGTWLGYRLHDRLDQQTFRKGTQILLVLTGLNLIRDGLM
ncbi:sulfite exporter TauE/SafE family protein [Frigidibacter oleivorans]|uniref:sulfite exporter TauE/SafE family protein n=1 Tax=Frigidibacter oleivorans TaxID=2487129 RepID=UPI000F8CC83A|nr:sulfite exporter TauE/SafE family protein [Frigidibacter oleivorans]